MKIARASSLWSQRSLLLAAFVVTGIAPLTAETVDVINKTFAAAPGGKLVVDVDTGGIESRGAPGSAVVIEITRKVSAASDAEEERILKEHVVTINQSGDVVTIHARGPRGGNASWWRQLFGGGTSRRYTFKVTLPAEFDVDLKTSGGGIDVATLTGDVRTNTSGGGLKFTGITGNIRGNTSGGGIQLEQCHGQVDVDTSGGGIKSMNGEGAFDLNTSGGGITVRGHRGNMKAHTSGGGITCENIAGDVDAHTSGGSVHAELRQQPIGECRLSTSGGGVTVELPANARVELDAETSGGSVSSELPVTVTGEHKSRHLRGPINGGGPLVHLRSSGGSIRIAKGTETAAMVER